MARISIGALEFKSKKAAMDYFRAIRDLYADEEIISPENSAVLHELISCHPETAEKIGCGIRSFTVATEAMFRTRHYVLKRIDGSVTDFSFIDCINGGNIRRDILEALRRAIEDQVVGFRDLQFSKGKVLCPFLNIELSPLNSHVDHTPPASFMSLVESWLAMEQIALDQVVISSPKDNQIVTSMTDEWQMKAWSEFHRERAVLRLLSPKANLSQSKKAVQAN